MNVMKPQEMPNELGFWYAKWKFPRDVMQMQMQSDILEVCKMKIRVCKWRLGYEKWRWGLDLGLGNDVCKVDYAMDGVIGLIMMFGIWKMRISDKEENLVDRQVDRVW